MYNFLISGLFLLMATMMYCTKYIMVAIFLQESSLSEDIINGHLGVLPSSFTIMLWIATLIGLAFFVNGLRAMKEDKTHN